MRSIHVSTRTAIVAGVLLGLFYAALGALFCGLITIAALARDLGQWDATEEVVSKWYRDLKQPDNPQVSCCGEADAYEADSFEVEGDHYVAIITDTRPDAPRRRPHIEPGTRIAVPNHKMKWDEGNPTGHGIIFIGQPGVYCFVAPGGV